MAKTKILHIQGNEIMIGFPVKEMNAVLNNGVSSTQGKTEAIGESWVVLRRGILVRQYKTFPAHDFVFFSDKGHLPCGVYDIEVYYDTEDGQHMRLKYPQILTIVDSTEAGQIYESDDFDVDAYYPVINSRASAVVISNGAVSLFAGRGLNADIGEHSVNLRAGHGNSTIEIENNSVNIHIKD
jgi:hypothetical protein